MLRTTFFFILGIALLFPADLFAQVIPPGGEDPVESEERIGSQYSLLPIVGYSSDWGLYGGGLIQRIDYGNNVKPFLNNLQADVTISTKGNFVSEVNFEHTRTLGTGIRSKIDFIGQRLREDHYFGIGNQTEFSSELFDDRYFFYENRELFIEYQARKTILNFGEFGVLDLVGLATVSHVNGLTRGDESKFADDQPIGFGKSWVNKLGTGLVADSRNSEFVPTRGIRYEASYQLSSPIFGSGYTYSDLRLELRHYRELFRGVIFAHKLQLETILGDAPFWDLKMIGDEEGLRGYHEDRFRGDSSVMNLFELRMWLFSFFDDDIRVGGQLFYDMGRVYSEFDSNELFDNWKHSFGTGAVVSLFSPDLIVRADIGFSDEAFRIYFGAGYVF